MDQVISHQNSLLTAAIAVGLGLVTKKLIKFETVNTSGAEHMLASFVVVAAAAMGADYVIAKEKSSSRPHN